MSRPDADREASPLSALSESRALAATVASNILAVLPVFLLGALAVFIRGELRFSESALGVAASTFYGSSALLAVFGGRVSERLGPGTALRLAAICSAAAGIATALVVNSWAALVVTLVVAAFANAVAQPAANLALARTIRPSWQGTAFGIKQSAGPAGLLLAGVAVPAIALTFGWRWAYSLTVVMAILLWRLAAHVINAPTGSRSAQGRDLAIRPLLLMTVAVVLAVSSPAALGAFYVESAVNLGHDAATVGWWLALGSATAITVRILVGRWADGRTGGRMRLVIGMLVVGALGFALLGIARPLWLLVAATVLAFGAGWGWPGLFHYVVVSLNPRAPGNATGVIMVGIFAGGLIGPLTFGFIAQHTSYSAAWLTTALALCISAVLNYFAVRVVRQYVGRG